MHRIAALLLALTTPLAAEPLTLDRYLADVRAANPELRATTERAAAAEARIAQARADREAEGLSAEGEEDAQSDAVRLRQRAAPFIEMLRRSAAEDNDVVWGA